MPRPLNLIVLGTAGAGKSSLSSSFGKWIQENTGQSVAYINLDPGCDYVPFEPDFDIREYFTIERIMREEKLGPNGAMIRASERLKENVTQLSRRINEIEADVKMIDTPGQMEIFLFHGGREIAGLMSGTTLSLFLIDAQIAVKATGLTFAQLLGLSINLGLGVPTINVLNKIDLVKDELANIEQMLTDAEFSRKKIIDESRGVMIDLALGISKVLPELLPAARIAKVSAKTGEGMIELYDILHEVFCACGDLT